MPSKSPAQAKLMNIAAHAVGGYGGVHQAIGQEFHTADKAKSPRQKIAKALLSKPAKKHY